MTGGTHGRSVAADQPHWTYAAWWFTAGVVLGGVLALTVFPGSPAPYRWAANQLEPWVARGQVAAALNVALFLPVGAMIALTGRPKLLLLAPVMSVAIETIQWVIPQRNPALLDVALNSAGALLGYLLLATLRRAYLASRGTLRSDGRCDARSSGSARPPR